MQHSDQFPLAASISTIIMYGCICSSAVRTIHRSSIIGTVELCYLVMLIEWILIKNVNY